MHFYEFISYEYWICFVNKKKYLLISFSLSRVASQFLYFVVIFIILSSSLVVKWERENWNLFDCEGERRKIKQRRKVYHFHWVAVVLREGKIESSVLFIVKLPFPSPSSTSSSSSLRVFEVQGCCWIILSPLNINLSLLRHA